MINKTKKEKVENILLNEEKETKNWLIDIGFPISIFHPIRSTES